MATKQTDNKTDQTMRVNVTLDQDGISDLVKVMAAMPPTNDEGVPRTIGPADALRYALSIAAKGARR